VPLCGARPAPWPALKRPPGRVSSPEGLQPAEVAKALSAAPAAEGVQRDGREHRVHEAAVPGSPHVLPSAVGAARDQRSEGMNMLSGTWRWRCDPDPGVNECCVFACHPSRSMPKGYSRVITARTRTDHSRTDMPSIPVDNRPHHPPKTICASVARRTALKWGSMACRHQSAIIAGVTSR
jgi:hypothetical protein